MEHTPGPPLLVPPTLIIHVAVLYPLRAMACRLMAIFVVVLFVRDKSRSYRVVLLPVLPLVVSLLAVVLEHTIRVLSFPHPPEAVTFEPSMA